MSASLGNTDIYDFVVDHIRHFGCMPLEVVVYGVKNGCEYVFDFDEYRELLTEEQLTEIRRMLELEAE